MVTPMVYLYTSISRGVPLLQGESLPLSVGGGISDFSPLKKAVYLSFRASRTGSGW